jgi:hypothetical protein
VGDTVLREREECERRVGVSVCEEEKGMREKD